MQNTASTIDNLDPATVAAFRNPAQVGRLLEDRNRAGLSELIDCDGCEAGIMQRIVEDYAPDSGVSYAAVNGSSIVFTRVTPSSGVTYTSRSFYCPACTARPEAAV